MSWGLRRLADDVARWRAAGWVDAAGAEAILKDAEERAPRISLTGVLAVIAAALMSLAVISFVAANWQDMPRPLKLGVLLAAMIAAYVCAAVLGRRGAVGPAHAALLLGVGIFGATIMMVGQMYHLSGPPTEAIFVWACAALLAGVLFNSPPSLTAAPLLFLLWSEWTAFDAWNVAPHWLFAPAWAACALAIGRAGWSGGFHVLALSAGYWIVATAFRLDLVADRQTQMTLIAGAAAVIAAAALAERAVPSLSARARALTIYALLAGAAGLVTAQIVETGLDPAWAAITLAAIVAALWRGVAADHRALVWWSYGLLSAQLLLIFIATVGTLLDTALFFLVASLLAVGMAALAWRLNKARSRAEAAT